MNKTEYIKEFRNTCEFMKELREEISVEKQTPAEEFSDFHDSYVATQEIYLLKNFVSDKKNSAIEKVHEYIKHINYFGIANLIVKNYYTDYYNKKALGGMKGVLQKAIYILENNPAITDELLGELEKRINRTTK